MSTTTLQNRYYPTLSSVVTAEDLPDILGFIKDGAQNLLSHIYYKDFQYSKGINGDSAFYGLSIVSPERIQLEIPGTGIYLVLNPDLKEGVNNISVFPITIQWEWKVLAYLREFSLGNFSFSPQEIFEVAMRVLNVTEEQAIAHFVNTFVDTGGQDITPLHKFVNDLNIANAGQQNWIPLSTPTETTNITEVVKDIFAKTGKYATLVAFGAYILSSDSKETIQKVKEYFRAFIPQDIDEFIKEVIVPKFKATLLLSAGIEFPRSILKPVYPFGTKDNTNNDISLQENTDSNEKVILTFGEALFYADTTKGFGYNLDLKLNTTSPAMIGNTGLIIDIHNLKIDLNKKENILEADLDGRPKDFIGVYTEQTDIYLPSKWFKKTDNQTLGIKADHFLIGTGGVSGKLSLAATYSRKNDGTVIGYYNNVFSLNYGNLKVINKENKEIPIANYDALLAYINSLGHPSELKFKYPIGITHKNNTQIFEDEISYYSYLNSLVFDESEFMWLKLGKDKNKQWDLGFNKFDITFHQGTVVNSNLSAALKIKKLRDIDPDDPLQADIINLKGEYQNKENFRLSANFLPQGKTFTIFDSIYLTLQSAELGRQNNDFFIGADTKISFPDGSLANKLFKGQVIDLPAVRIYSNGRFEVVGGVSKIPVNFEMNLGPAKMNVTALHLGTIQKEYRGVMRTYNFIGFDGGININPGGIDVKGDGVKYYYTVDNDDLGLESDSFFHISTLEVEIVIPGGASEQEAEVLIKGSLTIPEPGKSSEYKGKIGLKVKSLGINAEVSMRYAPKYPAYIVAAKVGLNKPIPIGPISITGFNGLIGYRYVAEKEAIGMTSENTWYDYYVAPKRGINEDKFSGPERTKDYGFPFSLGIGASFEITGAPKIISLRAMVLLSLPKMYAVDAGLNILGKRLGLAETDDSEANFFAFVIFGDNSFEFGAGADYRLNKNGWFIDLHAEMQAGFFFKNQRPWYINFGTREKPVSAVLFKDFLNLKSQSFVMISAKGIEAGARAEFKLQLAKIAKAWAIVEVGGKISFEKPQVGAYIYLEGGIDINIRFIRIMAVLSTYLSVELIKPFKIYAELKFEFRIKILFFKLKIKVTLTLKWEKSNEVDRTPIPAITFEQPNSDIDYYKPATHLEAVKGVHMMTQEVFDIDYIPVLSSSSKSAERQISEYFEEKYDEISVIPLDTYIDFKSEKALFPSKKLDEKIGGHTGVAADFIELIPPEKTVKGGYTIRQVKHKYIIEDIEIKAHTGTEWVEYHPFKALSPNTDIENVDLTKLKIGHWQRKNEKYDSIRILASNPFSFLDGAAPGWFVPEQYGITPSEIFCESKFVKEHVSNFDSLAYRTIYYPPTHYPAHFINGAYYNIKGDYYQSFEIDEDGNLKEVVSENVMKITFLPNNNIKSLEFSNANTLVVTLPQDSVYVKLKLSSHLEAVKIVGKKPIINDKSGAITGYENVAFGTWNKNLIADNEIKLEVPKLPNEEYDLSKAFSIIEITPQVSNLAEIEAVKAEMNTIVEYADLNTNGVISGAKLDRYEKLKLQLSNLKNNLCVSLKSNLSESISQKSSVPVESSTSEGCLELNKSILYEGFNNFYSKGVKLINDQQTLNSLYYSFTHDRLGNVGRTTPQTVDFTAKSVLVLTINTYSPIQSANISANIRKIVQKDNTVSVCYDTISIGGTPINSNRAIVILTDKITNDKVLVENQNCNCSNDSTPTVACRNLAFRNLLFSLDCRHENYFAKVINNQNEFNIEYIGLGMKGPQIDFSTKSVILISFGIHGLGSPKYFVNKVIKRQNKIDLCFTKIKDCNSPDFNIEQVTYPYILIETEKLPDNYPIDLNTNCDCPDTNNIVYNICDFTDIIQEELLNNINYNLSFEDNRIHFDNFMGKISKYDYQTQRVYTIGDRLEWNNIWEDHEGTTLEDALISVKWKIEALKMLDCCIKDESQYSCYTYLQYVKWQTLEDWEYKMTIPGIEAVKEDNIQAINAQTKVVQPVWRPNTKYYIKFKLRDEVDNNTNPNSGVFNYYYGFRTVGPVGHFHKKHKEYLLDETKKDLDVNDPNRYKKPEEFSITSLAPYIDYRRSYPNADGNILNAKPLFYGNEQCKINIYLDRPFAYHLLNKWEKYGDLPEYNGTMNIVIKDPVSEEIIPYPLPQEMIVTGEIPKPVDDGNWKDDNDPRIPLQIKILKNYIAALNSNEGIECSGKYGDLLAPIQPKSYSYEVKLTDLKPNKLYTAMIYNAFDDNSDNSFDPQKDSNGVIVYEENQLVHQYVFATSRYANFRNQVMSYWLEDKDENGLVIGKKQAVFNLELDLTDTQINNAYTLIAGSSNPQTDILEKQYINEFDRVLEGVFAMKPLDPPTCTDFITIRDKNGNMIAILVRNPEPFNDPKISKEEITDTLQVMKEKTENIEFKKLFSKDYSQVLIMHNHKIIEEQSLVFKFLYKTWNPEIRKYEVNQADINNSVITDAIIING